MKKYFAWIFFIISFLIFPLALATSIFTITTNDHTVRPPAGGAATITYTIQNTSGTSLSKLIYLPPEGTTITNTTCGRVLANQASCVMTVTFQAPFSTCESIVTLAPMKVCAGDGDICSQANAANITKVIITPVIQFFTITPTADPGLTIFPSTPQVVAAGSDLTFTGGGEAPGDTVRWFVDGVLAQTGGTTFTLTNIQANHTVLFTTAASGSLTITVNPSTSLQYQSLHVANNSGAPAEITAVTIPSSLMGKVKWCQSSDTACFHQSTCALNMPIAPTTSCDLWFQSIDDSTIALGSQSDSLEIDTTNGSDTFMMNYEMDLYVAGLFTSAGGTSNTRNIAKWNGLSWSALGTGSAGPSASTIIAYHGDLYLGGNFTSVGGASGSANLARWDGTNWSSFAQPNGQVSSMLVSSTGDLYVGGAFTGIGGVSASKIAVFDGTNWSPLGTGVTGGLSGVSKLIEYGGNIYAGGGFASAGGVLDTACIAQWNGSSWLTVGGGGNPCTDVLAFGINNGLLYVGGDFTQMGSVANTESLAIWNGSTWLAFPTTTTNSQISGLTFYNGNFIVIGPFASINGVSASGVAQWNGVEWLPLGTGFTSLSGIGGSLIVQNNIMYAGWAFTNAGGVSGTSRVASWDGSAWGALGTGVNNQVFLNGLQAISSLTLQ